MNNNLGRAVDGNKNVSEIIKTRIEEIEEDVETKTKTLRINTDRTKSSEKKVLEDCITGCGYEIIGSTEGYENVGGNGQRKGYYEFYVVKKESVGVC